MSFLDHVRLMAGYNTWMNGRILDAVARLDPEARWADRGAFFGSAMGTLNHLVVTDLIWLRRIAGHPAGAGLAAALDGLPVPSRLDEIVFRDLDDLRAARLRIDAVIEAFAAGLAEADLDVPLAYRRVNGEGHVKALGPVLSHVFNHQTHHRGQITTLLTQAGIDPGATDVILLVPETA